MWKFFQSLFSTGSSKSDADVSLEGWGEGEGFKSETPAKMQMRTEYDHLVFFQQGSDHNTVNLIRKRTPDSATIIANCTLTHSAFSSFSLREKVSHFR